MPHLCVVPQALEGEEARAVFWAKHPLEKIRSHNGVRCLSEKSPLAILMGNLYLLADRKARRWGRSGMQRLEDSRDTPGRGGKEGRIRTLERWQPPLPWDFLFPIPESPPRTFRTGKLVPLGVPILSCVFMFAPHLCHQHSFIRQAFIGHLFLLRS